MPAWRRELESRGAQAAAPATPIADADDDDMFDGADDEAMRVGPAASASSPAFSSLAYSGQGPDVTRAKGQTYTGHGPDVTRAKGQTHSSGVASASTAPF